MIFFFVFYSYTKLILNLEHLSTLCEYVQSHTTLQVYTLVYKALLHFCL